MPLNHMFIVYLIGTLLVFLPSFGGEIVPQSRYCCLESLCAFL